MKIAAWSASLLLWASAHGQNTVWQQSPDIQDDWGPSQIGGGVNSEVADDFDLVGTINEIRAKGYKSGMTANPPLTGMIVRFYEFGPDNKPGALQQQYTLAVGDPHLTVLTPAYPNDFNIVLDPPFAANGRHFVSVQAQMEVVFSSRWYWRSSNTDNPSGEAVYMRFPGIGLNDWSHGMYIEIGGGPYLLATANSDAAFTLIGTATPAAPQIANLANAQVTLADRLVINGDSFGAQTGSVTIGGVPAAISAWSNLQITAYPRDVTPLGQATVVVTNASGSDSISVSVIARTDPDGAGPAKWRFRADGLYIDSRPAVAADGTIYVNDVNGHLYALEPDGGVKWIVRLNPPLAYQPPEVAADGTIYVAAYLTIYALNPDGTVRWQFTDTTGADRPIFAGPSVGPDGNIYAADADFDDGTGLGAFSLTTAGVLRWNLPGFYHWQSGVQARGQEIVFDSHDQLYFANSAIGPGAGSFYAITLDGEFVFPEDASPQQLDVSPDGNVIYGAIFNPFSPASLVAMDSSGDYIFSIFGNGQPSVTAGIDVGGDGNLYTGITPNAVVSVNPKGSVRWTTAIPNNSIRYDPIVSPDDSVVAVASYQPNEHGEVRGLDATTGEVNWLVTLPFENDGFVWPMYRARPRFSPDGLTVYLGTTHNNYLPDPYCYLYAIDAASASNVTNPVDINSDGYVNVNDLLAVIGAWGACPAPPSACAADVNHDGSVNVNDLLLVIGNWS